MVDSSFLVVLFFLLFFLRMIGDVVSAKPYEVNVLTGQIVFFFFLADFSFIM